MSSAHGLGPHSVWVWGTWPGGRGSSLQGTGTKRDALLRSTPMATHKERHKLRL